MQIIEVEISFSFPSIVYQEGGREKRRREGLKERNKEEKAKWEGRKEEQEGREKEGCSMQLCTTHKISLVMFLSKHEHPSRCVWLLKFVVDGDE